MWLEVSVGLGPKLTGFGAVGTFGFSCTCTAVACSRVSSNAASESFGLAAESMLNFRRAFSHSRVRTRCVDPVAVTTEKSLLILLTSAQTRLPAELKHITKRRKRNQRGFP